MRVTYIAEHDDARRVTIPTAEPHGAYVVDIPAAYRECARLLRERPTAHRVECWAGTQYVTRATRGVVVPTTADLFAGAQDDRDDPRIER